MSFKKYKKGKYTIWKYDDGGKEWFVNGKLHNENGPACDYKEYKVWFLNDKEYSEEEWTIEMRRQKLKALGL